jgi:hypothetical protein
MKRFALGLAAAVMLAGCISTLVVDGYSVACTGVDPGTCQSVGALAINNMARSRPTGALQVHLRLTCPAVPDWADPSTCWQVEIPAGTSMVCMVIARRPVLGGFGQVAGDVPGLAGPQRPSGCPA